MYLSETNDKFPPNISGNSTGQLGFWVLGNAQPDTNSAGITNGVLYRHIGATASYRCPADESPVLGAKLMLRVRSYRLLSWLNSDFVWHEITAPSPNPQDSKPRLNMSEIGAPSEVFTFLDEHEQRMNDGGFYISPYPSSPDKVVWMKLTSSRLGQGLNLSFLDGHADGHKSKWPKSSRDHLIFAKDDLQDLRWLQGHLPPARQ